MPSIDQAAINQIFNKLDEIRINFRRFHASYTRPNTVLLDFGGEQSNPVPTSVEELEIPRELAEQDDEDKSVSPAYKTDLNMPLPNFGGEQADSVPPSVEQLGNCGSEPSGAMPFGSEPSGSMPFGPEPSTPKTPRDAEVFDVFGNSIIWPPKSGGTYMRFSRDEEPDAWYTTMLNTHANKLATRALPNPA